jgi:hypothetical protein
MMSLAPIWRTVDHAYHEFLEFAFTNGGPMRGSFLNTFKPIFLTIIRRKIMANSNQGKGGNQGNQGNQGDQGNQGGGKGGSKQSDQGTSGRGFASMDPEQQREIAAEGGRAAHAAGTAHEFTSEEARRAGSMSHKNDGSQQSGAGGSRSGGQQDSEEGEEGGNSGNSGSRGTRGGSPEQHAEAGRQSHKNDRK